MARGGPEHGPGGRERLLRWCRIKRMSPHSTCGRVRPNSLTSATPCDKDKEQRLQIGNTFGISSWTQSTEHRATKRGVCPTAYQFRGVDRSFRNLFGLVLSRVQFCITIATSVSMSTVKKKGRKFLNRNKK